MVYEKFWSQKLWLTKSGELRLPQMKKKEIKNLKFMSYHLRTNHFDLWGNVIWDSAITQRKYQEAAELSI